MTWFPLNSYKSWSSSQLFSRSVLQTILLPDSPYLQFLYTQSQVYLTLNLHQRRWVCIHSNGVHSIDSQALETHKWIKQSPVLSSNSTGLEPASQRSGLYTKERLEMGVTPNNGLFSNHHIVLRKNEWLQGKGGTFQEMKSHVAT